MLKPLQIDLLRVVNAVFGSSSLGRVGLGPPYELPPGARVWGAGDQACGRPEVPPVSTCPWGGTCKGCEGPSSWKA